MQEQVGPGISVIFRAGNRPGYSSLLYSVLDGIGMTEPFPGSGSVLTVRRIFSFCWDIAIAGEALDAGGVYSNPAFEKESGIQRLRGDGCGQVVTPACRPGIFRILGGGGGIRTHGSGKDQRFSRPPRSTTPSPHRHNRCRPGAC